MRTLLSIVLCLCWLPLAAQDPHANMLKVLAYQKAHTSSGGGGGGTLTVQHAWKGTQAADNNPAVSATVAPTAGNFLVVVLTDFQGANANHTMSDNIGSTTGWVKAIGQDGTGSIDISIWYKFAIPSGITTISANAGTGGRFPTVIVHEVSGGTGAFTGGEASAQSQTGTAFANVALNNATAASIFFSMASNDTSANPATYTKNQSGSVGTWLQFDATNSRELNGASFTTADVVYLVVSSANSGSKNVWLNSSGSGATAIACFH